MKSAVSTLKNSKLNQCVCNSCKKQNCHLKLSSDFPSAKIILDIDCITREIERVQGKVCDYLIVAEKDGYNFFLPVEFKTTNIKPNEIKEQMEGGIRFFKKHAGKHCDKFTCYPVLVSERLKHIVHKYLINTKVKFNGKDKRIKHVKCNNSLSWKKVVKSQCQTQA